MNYVLKEIEKTRAAEAALLAAIKEHYPVGARLQWVKEGAGTIQTGRVEMHSYNSRIKVKNEKTGSCYWITANSIC